MAPISLFITIAKGLKISPALLLAICSAESDFRNVVVADDGGSPSYGICQVKLNTARMFSSRTKIKDMLVIRKNVWYAGSYLRYQLKRYKSIRLAIAAYNTGTVKRNNGKIINRAYIKKVLKRYYHFRRVVQKQAHRSRKKRS